MQPVKRTVRFPAAKRSHLPAVASAVLRSLGPDGGSVALSGPLGAGKSTLARAIGAALGIQRMVSPTYVLVRRYRTRSRRFPHLIHADCYRLPRGADLAATGLPEAMSERGALTLIEWPERAPKLAPDVLVRCALVPNRPDRRTFVLARRRQRRRRG